MIDIQPQPQRSAARPQCRLIAYKLIKAQTYYSSLVFILARSSTAAAEAPRAAATAVHWHAVIAPASKFPIEVRSSPALCKCHRSADNLRDLPL